MAERTGPVQAQHRAHEDRVQAAYRRLIRHTQLCAECRTEGVDCEDATDLKAAWRAARQGAAA